MFYYNVFKKFRNRKAFDKILLNEEKEELQFESNNIEIYTSIRAGFGKTEEIRNKIILEKKNYKYFPLGGDFTR